MTKNQLTTQKEPSPIPEMVSNPNIQTERGAVFNDLNAQMTAIEAFGNIIARSGFNNCTKVEQGVIIAFTCMAEKITPLDFAQKYDLIHGRPTKKAAVMLAEFRQMYGGDFEWTQDGEDGKTATIVLTYRGKKKKPVSFTIAEAKNLGLTGKDNWQKQPSAMLRARCATKALRMHVPEIAAGIYDPDEIPHEEAKTIDEKSYMEQFQELLKGRSELEQEKIQVFIKEKWPKGMVMSTIKKCVENFDTFVLTAMKSTGGLD